MNKMVTGCDFNNKNNDFNLQDALVFRLMCLVMFATQEYIMKIDGLNEVLEWKDSLTVLGVIIIIPPSIIAVLTWKVASILAQVVRFILSIALTIFIYPFFTVGWLCTKDPYVKFKGIAPEILSWFYI